MHLGLQGMVFIYFIYFSFLLSYSLQSNIIVRQSQNYNPDSLFVLSTREYYSAFTANLLIGLIRNTLPTDCTVWTYAARLADGSRLFWHICVFFLCAFTVPVIKEFFICGREKLHPSWKTTIQTIQRTTMNAKFAPILQWRNAYHHGITCMTSSINCFM